MTAFLLALTVATRMAADQGVLTGKPYLVQLTINRGDPLGSRADGTVDVLSRPQLLLCANRTGFFQVGQQGVRQVTIRATPAPVDGDPSTVQFALSFQSEVFESPAPEDVGQDMMASFDRRLKIGVPTTLRVAAWTPTDQVWIVITAKNYVPEPPRKTAPLVPVGPAK